MSAPKSRWTRSVTWVLVLAVVGAAGYFGFRAFRGSKTDTEAAVSANNRGVAYIERFMYEEAAAEFRKAGTADPAWLTPKFNLAVAYVNLDPPKYHAEAQQLFQQVLNEEPGHRHALFTWGCLKKYQQDTAGAYALFVKVTDLDPNDAHSWYLQGVCHPEGDNSAEAQQCYRKALDRNPYLNAARYALLNARRDPKERLKLMEEFKQLQTAFWEKQYAEKYFDMGPYSEVLGSQVDRPERTPSVGPLPMFSGSDPNFRVRLAEGTRWATDKDLSADPHGPIRTYVRRRFGGAMAFADLNLDGRIDVVMVGAVVQQGRIRDLVLRQETDGSFVDVTADWGFAAESTALGCAIADFDNDGRRDLVFTGIGKQQLFRNRPNGKFEDVSAKAGLDKVGGVCLGASWVDLDQDSDLDLVLAEWAPTADAAKSAVAGQASPPGRLLVVANTGDAEPVPAGDPHPPLTTSFKLLAPTDGLKIAGRVIGTTATDVDDDGDVDLIVFADDLPPHVLLNDRLMRFRSMDGYPFAAAKAVGGLVGDFNRDGRSDLLVEFPDADAAVWSATGKLTPGQAFSRMDGRTAPLRQCTLTDLDGDGWFDVVGVDPQGTAVLLHNTGDGKLVRRESPFGNDLKSDLLASYSFDLNGDGSADFVAWSASTGLDVRPGQPNGNSRIRLELSGRYHSDSTRTNSDGIGIRVSAQAGRLFTSLENTTLQTGLGQSRIPLELGIGKNRTADAVRIRWPDNVPQAELAVAADGVQTIVENNRKVTSCPILFVWDGKKFRYVTDFLGVGALGEAGPDGAIRPARRGESIKIEPGLLIPDDRGRLRIKIAEPMDELMYLDHVRIRVFDHPPNVEVYPDERFVAADPYPSGRPIVFSSIAPISRAVDQRGNNVTAGIQDRDGRTIHQFRRRSWLGYAEEHYLELTLPSENPPDHRRYLIMAGWTDYAYPESIYAATQAGVATIIPTIEIPDGENRWKVVGELGFPAGLPRVMVRDLTDIVPSTVHQIRIRTNLRVYWDQIRVGWAKPNGQGVLGDKGDKGDGTQRIELPVEKAVLSARGFMMETRPDPDGPIEYDDSRRDKVSATAWKGMFTRFGDVTALLTAEDDRFALCGPGEEIEITFDAGRLPPLREGWKRSYILDTSGYCKDTAPTTRSGGCVEPLPFRGMSTYPNFTPADREKSDRLHADYRREWNTRTGPGGP